MKELLARLRKLLGPNPVVRVVLTPDDEEAIEELLALVESGALRAGVPEGFYLASFKSGGDGYQLWWAPDDRGYTTDLSIAGVYTKIKPGYHDSEHTVPVPVAFMRGKRIRQIVDIGDDPRGAFCSADNLRKAIEVSPQQREVD